ncbi:MAG: aminopeptidase P family protein [Deltaproteobacteria bacterium]|nr:aminopeptidase P family protein [Deltaproteobacteria bacterium]
MSDQSIDMLLIHSPVNILYLTGYQTFGLENYMCLFVPLNGKLTLLLRFLEYGLMKYFSWIDDGRAFEDHEDPVALTSDLLKEKGAHTAKIGVEMKSRSLTLDAYNRLRLKLDQAEFVDGSNIVEKVRMIKSPQEIHYMREAAGLTRKGMKRAYETVQVGNTENQVAAAAYMELIGTGGDCLTKDPIVTSGFRSGIPHTTLSNRKFEAGDTVLIELSGSQRKYYAPLMGTACAGKPSDRVRRMADAAIEGLHRAIDALKPGVTSHQVHMACEEVIEKAGYSDNFRKRTGYSVGAAVPPNWGEGHIIDLKRGDERGMEPGMVFHMPVAMRSYGEFCVGFSQTVLVTEQGNESLTDFPAELFVGY